MTGDEVHEGDSLFVLVGGSYSRATAFKRDDGQLWTVRALASPPHIV